MARTKKRPMIPAPDAKHPMIPSDVLPTPDGAPDPTALDRVDADAGNTDAEAVGAAVQQSTAEDADVDLSYIAEPLRVYAVPIASLTFDPMNARLHDEANLRAIAQSLRRFGQDQLLVVQKQGMIVRKGNGRLAAALQLGWTHIAAVVIDEDNWEAAARALADNRTAELAQWDTRVLQATFAELQQHGSAYDDLGWQPDEIKTILELEQPTDMPTDVPTDLPPPKYQVLATLPDETTQGKLLEELTRRGVDCRSLIG